MLLCGEFDNAHLDTSFASIDPKILKLRQIEGTYLRSENCTKSYCTSVWPSLNVSFVIGIFEMGSEGWRGIKNNIIFTKYSITRYLLVS